MMTFGAVSLSVLAVSLDGAVLSVALPTLATALHTSESDLEWFWSGYLLLLAAAVLFAGLSALDPWPHRCRPAGVGRTRTPSR